MRFSPSWTMQIFSWEDGLDSRLWIYCRRILHQRRKLSITS
jgi:hypothetical protein